MRQVVLTFDDEHYSRLCQVCDFSPEALRDELTKAIALLAYRARGISLAKAAEVAGIGLWEMIDLARQMGLPVYEYDDDAWEVEKDGIEKLTPTSVPHTPC